jgi:fimbrial isopeptide formation D2 family protein/LPXTG-motif cell wall-anchored protein
MKRKNGFKRITAFLTALIMLISCMLSVSLVNAEETVFKGESELTVSAMYGNRTFDLYQIFKGDMQQVNGRKTLIDITWGDSIKSSDYDYTSAFITELKKSTLADGTANPLATAFENITTSSSAEAVAETLIGAAKDDSEQADAYAQIVSNVISGKDVAKRSATTSETAATNGGNHHAVFSDLHDGYYLISPDATTGSVATATFSKFMLAVVGDSLVNTKTNSVPTIDKEIIKTDENGAETKTRFSDVAIGDEVQFRLESAVPGMSGYSKYFFVIQDELSKGLTFDVAKGIKSVKIGNETIPNVTEVGSTAAKWFKVEEITNTTDSNAQAFKIVFHNFIQYNTGDKIVVDYVATVNDKAVLGKGSNTMDNTNMNQARIEYSNNPNYNYTGEDEPSDEDKSNPASGKIGDTEWSKTFVYTTGIEILKKDSTSGDRLAGATFKITGKKLNTVLLESDKYIAVDYATGHTATANDYYKQKDSAMTTVAPTAENENGYVKEYVMYAMTGEDEYEISLTGGYFYDEANDEYVTETKADGKYAMDYIVYEVDPDTESVTTVTNAGSEDVECEGTVGTNGELLIEGLAAGTYEITEVVAPNGYKLLDNPITVTITWAAPTADEINKGCTWTYTYTDENNKVQSTNATEKGWLQLIVKNSMGSTLPSTGGIGTTIFYTLGSALLIGAAVLLITKRRMSREEN